MGGVGQGTSATEGCWGRGIVWVLGVACLLDGGGILGSIGSIRGSPDVPSTLDSREPTGALRLSPSGDPLLSGALSTLPAETSALQGTLCSAVPVPGWVLWVGSQANKKGSFWGLRG